MKYTIAVTKHIASYFEVVAESHGEAIVKLSLLLAGAKDPVRVVSSIDHQVVEVTEK